MRIKLKNLKEVKMVLDNLVILPYEEYVDLSIETQQYRFFISNKRDENTNAFIPHEFRFKVFWLSEDRTEEWKGYENKIFKFLKKNSEKEEILES